MKKNVGLQVAKAEKYDEFYTLISDIEKELGNYKEQLKDKIIFCNCDDPEESNFWKYFYLNFHHLGLKRLISTHYQEEGSSYSLEYDGENIIKTDLKENGDFRSQESIKMLKEADIVITNPPFSLFREYLGQLVSHSKKFLIIGNMNAITYKDVFKLIKEDKIWLGHKSGSFKFMVPETFQRNNSFIGTDGKRYASFGNICWYTNLDVSKRHEDIIPYKTYNPLEYPKYDNFDAININKVVEIPKDYDGPMAVPITFLTKYNPKQFEILGNLGSYGADGYSLCGAIYVNKKKIFKRILIKKRGDVK